MSSITNPALAMRMKRELSLLETSPPEGISGWPKDDKITLLEGSIAGPVGTPYEKGVFKLEINIPDSNFVVPSADGTTTKPLRSPIQSRWIATVLITVRYPFEPPKVRFLTPIYHPNIDTGGRGAWSPGWNISTVLTSIQSLIAEPNPDDGLMADITNEYKHNKSKFVETAKLWTQRYAIENHTSLTVAPATVVPNEPPKQVTEPTKSKKVVVEEQEDSEDEFEDPDLIPKTHQSTKRAGSDDETIKDSDDENEVQETKVATKKAKVFR